MAKKKVSQDKLGMIGHWVFIVAVVVALLAGFFQMFRGPVATSLLVILGILVGLLNVTEKETMNYLLAAIAMVIVAGLGSAVLGTVQYIGVYLQRILSAVMVFVIPTAVIVALKSIYRIAANK